MFYAEICDLLEELADAFEVFDSDELECFLIDIGYYNCKKEYNLDVDQFDLDLLETLKVIKESRC